MYKKGFQLTCSGCGITTFLKDSEIVSSRLGKSLILETHATQIIHDKPDSWVRVYSEFHLCPRCTKIHEEMLCKFYERCGEERDKEEKHEFT